MKTRFSGLNERGLQMGLDKGRLGSVVLLFAADMMRKENMELVFEGLDTYADVYLNDEWVILKPEQYVSPLVYPRQAVHQGGE